MSHTTLYSHVISVCCLTVVCMLTSSWISLWVHQVRRKFILKFFYFILLILFLQHWNCSLHLKRTKKERSLCICGGSYLIFFYILYSICRLFCYKRCSRWTLYLLFRIFFFFIVNHCLDTKNLSCLEVAPSCCCTCISVRKFCCW
jgi:hypothetical protein